MMENREYTEKELNEMADELLAEAEEKPARPAAKRAPRARTPHPKPPPRPRRSGWQSCLKREKSRASSPQRSLSALRK